MKLLAILSLLVISMASPETQRNSNPNIDIVEGLFRGMGFEVLHQDLKTCLSDMKSVFLQIQQEVSQCEIEDHFHIKKVLKEIGLAFEGLSTTLKDCEIAGEDLLQVLNHGFFSFRSPWGFVYSVGESLMLNGTEIWNEIVSAIADWKSNKWESFGYNLGRVMAQLFKRNGHLDLQGYQWVSLGWQQNISLHKNMWEIDLVNIIKYSDESFVFYMKRKK